MKKESKVTKAKEQALKDIAKDVSFNDMLNEFKTSSDAKANKVSTLYKDEVYADLNKKEKKAFRMKIRRKRNNILKDIISFHKAKDAKAKAEALKTFNSFYKTFYKLNDLSLNSLCNTNSDDDTKALINEALLIIKKAK